MLFYSATPTYLTPRQIVHIANARRGQDGWWASPVQKFQLSIYEPGTPPDKHALLDRGPRNRRWSSSHRDPRRNPRWPITGVPAVSGQMRETIAPSERCENTASPPAGG